MIYHTSNANSFDCSHKPWTLYELLCGLYRYLLMCTGYEISSYYKQLQVCLSDDFCNLKKTEVQCRKHSI